jgi:ADP-heptose:LPS heptosyltransferase/O-antigen ligase
MSARVQSFQQTTSSVRIWLKANLATILLLLTLFLFVSKSLYNLPVAIMALIGLARCIRKGKTLFSDLLIRNYTLLFLALWIPMLVSLVDAVDLGHSAKSVFPYLRFLFMGIYILDERHHSLRFPLLQRMTFWIATFWAIDAVLQYATGQNLLGYPYEQGHITGMFYPDNTITHILAALSPLYFDSVRRYSVKNPAFWALILPLLAVVLLGGRRAAWIMLALGVCGYLYFVVRYTDIWKSARRHLLLIGFACLTMLALIVYINPSLQNRIETTAGLFSLDYELADQATARRLPIWETSLEIIQDHWINGIGPRGFRHVYQQYSTEDNYFHEIGTTHPHLLLLEVLTETGLIGLAGLMLFALRFWRFFIVQARLQPVYPTVLSVAIVLFPLTSSLAFYGSYWSTVIWWFLLYAFIEMHNTGLVSRKESALSVLIIKMGALGDLIMSTSLIRTIIQHHTGEPVYLLTSPGYARLFEDWHGLTVQSFPRRGLLAMIQTLAWIRKGRFARIYDLQSSERTALICLCSGVSSRVGNHPGPAYTLHPQTRYNGKYHAVERLKEVLACAGINRSADPPFLPVSHDSALQVSTWLAGQGLADGSFVLMHAGASAKHPHKCWPYFAELALELKASGLQTLWLGGKDDQALNERLTQRTGINTTGLFSIQQEIALGRHARFAVTNDSAPMHILSCSGIPVFGLFGPTDWRRSHAVGQEKNVISVASTPAFPDSEFIPGSLADLPVSTVLERLFVSGVLSRSS